MLNSVIPDYIHSWCSGRFWFRCCCHYHFARNLVT